jgi:hypothetical protein
VAGEPSFELFRHPTVLSGRMQGKVCDYLLTSFSESSY